jgi:hypothetical protein
MKIIQTIKLSIAITILLFSSCKKATVTAPSDNVYFELNQKTAYSIAEEISVTNKSVGTWSFEWYIDDQLVSENIILTKDKLKGTTKNIKHELKLVGVNSGGIIKICLDTFEYRDTIHFNSVKFSNYSSDFIKRLTEDTLRSYLGLDLRFSNNAYGFIRHSPPNANCLISYGWKLDSFRAYDGKYFNPRTKDVFSWVVNPSGIKYNYINTDMFNIQDKLYCLYGSRMDNNKVGAQGGIINTSIMDIKLDRKNKEVLIKTSQLDIALKI